MTIITETQADISRARKVVIACYLGWALAGVAGTVAVIITVLIAFGPEARDVKMGGLTPVAPE